MELRKIESITDAKINEDFLVFVEARKSIFKEFETFVGVGYCAR